MKQNFKVLSTSSILHLEKLGEAIYKDFKIGSPLLDLFSGLNLAHLKSEFAIDSSTVVIPIELGNHPVSKPTNQNSTFEQVNNVLVSHNARVMAVKSLNLNPAAEAMAIRKVTEETTTTLMKMTPIPPTGTCCCKTHNDDNWKQVVLNNADQEYQSIDDLGLMTSNHHFAKRLFANFPGIQSRLTDMYHYHVSRITQNQSSADFAYQSYRDGVEDQEKLKKRMEGIIKKYKGIFRLNEKVCTPEGMYKLKQELLYLRDESNLFIGENKDFPDKNYLYLYWALDGAKIFNTKYKVDERKGRKQSPAWGKFAGFINDILELGLESKENGITNLAAAMSKVLRDNKNYSMVGCKEQYCQCCKNPHIFSNECDDNYDELAANVSIAIQRLKDNVLN